LFALAKEGANPYSAQIKGTVSHCLNSEQASSRDDVEDRRSHHRGI
jgi:hypothetical protein